MPLKAAVARAKALTGSIIFFPYFGRELCPPSHINKPITAAPVSHANLVRTLLPTSAYILLNAFSAAFSAMASICASDSCISPGIVTPRQLVRACCPLPATLETVDGLLCKSVGITRHRQYGRRFVVRLQRREAFCKS